MQELKYAFAVHLCTYLGIALVAGSIVHAGTLGGSTSKYVSLVTIGILMTILGNLLEHKQKNQKLELRVIGLAILLSFGTGMLSGGIQHYLDNPIYGAGLLAVGLVLTFVGLAYKDFAKFVTLKSVVVVILTSILLYVLLATGGASIVMHMAGTELGHQNGHHD